VVRWIMSIHQSAMARTRKAAIKISSVTGEIYVRAQGPRQRGGAKRSPAGKRSPAACGWAPQPLGGHRQQHHASISKTCLRAGFWSSSRDHKTR
jgi:hypothetical protein